MPYNPQTKLLYIHIPKTAGTSITEFLEFKQGKEYCYILNAPKKDPVALHHMTPIQLVKYGLLTKRELFQSISFTFVRNPFDRLVSEFHYQNQELGSDAYFGKCFREYVNTIRKHFVFRRWNAYDNHLRPQWHFLSYKNTSVLNYTFRFEQLEADLEKIIDIGE
jgi:hypothetical protein